MKSTYPSDSEIRELSVCITRDLSLDESSAITTDNWEDLLVEVERIVVYLLENDMPRLLNILYIMDVEESQIKQALSCNKETPSALIAKLIVFREWQKVQTRQWYRQRGQEPCEEELW